MRTLERSGADVWVASAQNGVPHLVPLSYAWHEGCVLIACEDSSRTAGNILAAQRARLGFGPTRDVVIVDVDLQRSQTTNELDEATANAYARQSGWDARVVTNNVVLFLRPQRIQAWREVDEIEGRTVMRAGNWLA